MCRSPLTIVNPSRYVDIESSQPLYITVPCGKCSECGNTSRNEWFLRLYYEQLRAFNSGAFALFDTLTYRPDSLPRLSDFVDLSHLPSSVDFPCFSTRDIQLFNKRLRDRLPDGVSYRYIIVSEYGHDHGQKIPYRPHYHAIFFVYGDISPLRFSYLVGQSWQLGITDGLPFKPAQHVMTNVFRDVSPQIPRYVLKYVTKSFAYSSLVNSRLSDLFNLDKEVYLLSKKYVRQSHYQSLSFGYDYLLQCYSPDQLVKMSALRVMDKYGYRYIPFPSSLKRKVFYRYERDGKHVSWIPLPLLVSYNLHTLSDRIRKFAHRLTNVVPFSQAKSVAEYALLHRFRFRIGDARYVFENQYNDCKGFRNYSSKDRIFKYKVFTNQDFGSECDGYKRGFTLQYVPFGTGDYEFSRLDDFSKIVSVNDEFENILSIYSASVVGDPASDVDKVRDRVTNVFKTYVYGI